MADVSISYGGTEIATMDDSGAKTLQTSGKYCEDDITVTYTKSGGGTKELYVFTQANYTNTNVSIGTHSASVHTAYHSPSLVEGATVTFYSYGDYILDSVTGWESGNTIPFTTVSRGHYTFTMPNESVECALTYDD